MKKGTRSEALVVETPFPAVNLSTERFNPRILGSNLSVETDEGDPRIGRSLLLFCFVGRTRRGGPLAPLPPTLSRAAPHRARREAPASGWTCFAARRARRRAPNDRNRRATRTASWCVARGTSRLRVGTPSNVTCALQRALSKRSSPSLPLPSQVKPEHVREYRANAPLYVNEEAERADRWDAFLSRGEDGSVATPEKSARAASPSASASADVWGRHTLNAVEAILEGRAPGRSRPDAPRRELELQALVHGGVPMALRGEMWQLFAGVQHRRRPGLYRARARQRRDTSEDAVADDETEQADDPTTEEDVPEADERVVLAVSVPS